MSFNSILSLLGQAAKQLAPMIVPGAGPAIALGESIVKALDDGKEANGGQLPPEAADGHSALYNKVKAHADSTFDRLEGKS